MFNDYASKRSLDFSHKIMTQTENSENLENFEEEFSYSKPTSNPHTPTISLEQLNEDI